jgi:hypothetical protein
MPDPMPTRPVRTAVASCGASPSCPALHTRLGRSAATRHDDDLARLRSIAPMPVRNRRSRSRPQHRCSRAGRGSRSDLSRLRRCDHPAADRWPSRTSVSRPISRPLRPDRGRSHAAVTSSIASHHRGFAQSGFDEVALKSLPRRISVPRDLTEASRFYSCVEATPQIPKLRHNRTFDSYRAPSASIRAICDPPGHHPRPTRSLTLSRSHSPVAISPAAQSVGYAGSK